MPSTGGINVYLASLDAEAGQSQVIFMFASTVQGLFTALELRQPS